MITCNFPWLAAGFAMGALLGGISFLAAWYLRGLEERDRRAGG